MSPFSCCNARERHVARTGQTGGEGIVAPGPRAHNPENRSWHGQVVGDGRVSDVHFPILHATLMPAAVVRHCDDHDGGSPHLQHDHGAHGMRTIRTIHCRLCPSPSPPSRPPGAAGPWSCRIGSGPSVPAAVVTPGAPVGSGPPPAQRSPLSHGSPGTRIPSPRPAPWRPGTLRRCGKAGLVRDVPGAGTCTVTARTDTGRA
jgi:hypothetical protein